MNGYSSHTFRWVNKSGEAFWVKFHFKADAGIKNLSASDADKLKTTIRMEIQFHGQSSIKLCLNKIDSNTNGMYLM